jgi:hypothetical protein
MQQALQYCAWAIGLWLNLLVIAALVRGPYRQYPFVFAYSLALLLTTVAEMALRNTATGDQVYWIDEIILDALVYCLVIAFIDRAAREAHRAAIGRRWLILFAALIVAASFYFRTGASPNHRMTLISRDLNICAVVLDLILWSLLVAARRIDRRLMLLSGGLGMQLTGAIIGESLRHLSRNLVLTGTLIEVATSFLGLYIWWRALRVVPAAATA